MYCSISGTVPEEPVVDKKTGHLYEKKLIRKYIQETGKSPVTGESLDAEDLLQISSSQAAKPRPSPATTIPGLLSLLHNEWDATMLEVHTLRKDLGTVRQELSQALYQHDASVRVVARLQRELKERDALLSRFESMRLEPSAATNGQTEEPQNKRAKAGITKEIIEKMTTLSATLSKARKRRQISDKLAFVEDIPKMGLEETYALHRTTQGGITALDFDSSNENLVFTAGLDQNGTVFDRAANRIVSGLRGHTKKLTDIKVLANHNAAVTTSADKTSIIWRSTGDEGRYTASSILKDHTAEVSAVAVHMSGDYFVTASLDKSWAFYDIGTATCLQQVSSEGEGGYTAAKFHPDGLLMGAGTEDSNIRIWEVRQQKAVANLAHPKGAITSISFSENGYYLATSASDGVKLWDLRKLSTVKDIPQSSAPGFVSFDHSGLYLAVGGTSLDIHGTKQDWGIIKTFSDVPKKGIYSGKWGTDAKSLYIGASDHNLRYYSIKSEDEAVPME